MGQFSPKYALFPNKNAFKMVFKESFDLDWVVKSVSNEYGGIIDDIVQLNKAVERGWLIPANWQIKNGCGPSQVMKRIWGDGIFLFPQFIEFVKTNLSILFVADGKWGKCLVYFFTEANSKSELGYDISVMIGGAPTDTKILESFEEEFGALPSSLKTFWQNHNFSYLRNHSLLSSLLISTSASYPKIMNGQNSNSEGENEEIELLSFANVSSAMPFCFIRNLKKQQWGETVFQADKQAGSFYLDTSCSLDELISRNW